MCNINFDSERASKLTLKNFAIEFICNKVLKLRAEPLQLLLWRCAGGLRCLVLLSETRKIKYREICERGSAHLIIAAIAAHCYSSGYGGSTGLSKCFVAINSEAKYSRVVALRIIICSLVVNYSDNISWRRRNILGD